MAKGVRAGEDGVRDAGKGVLIGLLTDGLPGDLLRSRVVGSAEELPGPGQPGRRCRALGQPEVRQIGVLRAIRASVDEDVGRLDVTV